ncbi:hypothetical protein FGADI_8324 [Fusarium gaditjirri]|uniref:FAD-binding domain-containing protein n=1 Tax=Fusarium gaditjirri TaxID=282569 RepID=A0A8H4WUC9_9HYPO|nr:hypothetical protein FGADI_8324 [Fusarium gaditjirri]
MTDTAAPRHDAVEHLDSETVLIAGGGPVGLLVATVLAHYGVRSVVLERNNDTTKWPKMDLTNVSTLLILGSRPLGVPETTPYNVYMTTGLHNSKPITSWEYPSTQELRDQHRKENDGSAASEPWQRISQALFERFLKDRCDENDLIDCRFDWKMDKCTERDDTVQVNAVHVESKKTLRLTAKFMVACDGASSRTRRDLEIPLEGGPVPGYTLLVHFKSTDLSNLFKFGRFWYLFIFNDAGLHAAAICQDDKDVFTTHLLLPLDADHGSIDSHDAVYKALGGLRGPFKVNIDEILVRSAYRHSIAVARSYRSSGGKVFLAGDSAHQNIPSGGYGMNTGIGDTFDIAWKLAAVIKKGCGPGLLDSYEEERRPIVLRSIERSGVHMQAHISMAGILAGNASLVEEDSSEGERLRQRVAQHYQENNGENIDFGIEMDHRHKSHIYPSPTAEDGEEPLWEPSRYLPSTFPGSRAPHVFLKDGTSIFDKFGPYWTLIQFANEGDENLPESVLISAERTCMPLKHVVLRGEEHGQKLWEFPLVMIRVDGHVVWRGRENPGAETVDRIVRIAPGRAKQTPSYFNGGAISTPFSSTEKAQRQIQEYKLEQMGEMQM